MKDAKIIIELNSNSISTDTIEGWDRRSPGAQDSDCKRNDSECDFVSEKEKVYISISS